MEVTQRLQHSSLFYVFPGKKKSRVATTPVILVLVIFVILISNIQTVILISCIYIFLVVVIQFNIGSIHMNFINSSTGRACMAVRDNYIAAQSVGINVTKFRLIAFTVSAAIAGVAGVLYAHSLTVLAPKKFDYNLSILILVFVVLGGLGSLRGSVIATIVLYALPEIFRELGDYRMLIYAIVLILMMIFNNSPAFIAMRERLGVSAPVQKIKGIFTRKKNTAGGADNG